MSLLLNRFRFKSSALQALVVLLLFDSSMVLASQVAVRPSVRRLGFSAAACGKGFQRISFDFVKGQSEAYGRAAKEHLRSKFQALQEAEQRMLYEKGIIPAPGGVVESIPAHLLPSDVRLASMINRANETLQSRERMLEFVEETARRVKAERAQGFTRGIDPASLLEAESIETSVLQVMANDTGWGEIVPVVNKLTDREGFRTKALVPSRLFFDVNGVGTRHTGSAHLLQWLMITPKLDAEFGVGSAKELWNYLSTPEGLKLWAWTFDRGSDYMRDFRSPRAFSELQLAGEKSWFGVR